jgi:hypothetical protein
LKNTAFAVLLSALLAAKLYATSGADFLLLEPGAQAVSAGGAYVSVSGTLQALIYNPAGLAGIKGFTASFSHVLSIGDWTQDWVGLGYPAGGFCFGLEFLSSRLNSFTWYGASGQAIGSLQAGTTLVGIGVGAPILDTGLAIGVSQRFFASQLAEYHNSGYAMDAGLNYSLPEFPLNLGLSLQNMGEQTAFYQTRDELPLGARAGFGLEVYDSRAWSAKAFGDYVWFQDRERLQEIRTGIQASFLGHFWVSGGLDSRREQVRPALGAGLSLLNYGISYAYVPDPIFQAEQRFSFDYQP